jgi:hypothetical protein
MPSKRYPQGGEKEVETRGTHWRMIMKVVLAPRPAIISKRVTRENLILSVGHWHPHRKKEKPLEDESESKYPPKFPDINRGPKKSLLREYGLSCIS